MTRTQYTSSKRPAVVIVEEWPEVVRTISRLNQGTVGYDVRPIAEAAGQHAAAQTVIAAFDA